MYETSNYQEILDKNAKKYHQGATTYQDILDKNRQKFSPSADDIMQRNRNRFNSSAEINGSFINQFLNDYNDYYGNYALGNKSRYYRLDDRKASILDYLDMNREDIGEDYYNEVMRLMNQAEGYGMVSQYAGDYNSFYNDAAERLNNLGWEEGYNASGLLDLSGMNSRDAEVRQWLLDNKPWMDDSYYNQLIQRLDDLAGMGSALADGYTGAQDYYRQWDTQEAFDRHQRLLGMDIAEEEAWLQNFAKDYEDLQILEREYGFLTDYGGSDDAREQNRSRYEEILRRYGVTSAKELRQMDGVHQRRIDLRDAREIQAEAQLQEQIPKWQEKYAGKTYTQLSGVLETMEDGEEKQWLSQYADSIMTSRDMSVEIGKLNNRIAKADRVLEGYRDRMKDHDTGGSSKDDAEIRARANEYLQRNGYQNIEALEAEWEALNNRKWELDKRQKYGGIEARADFDTESKAKDGPQGILYAYINDLPTTQPLSGGKQIGTRESITRNAAEAGGKNPYERYNYMTDQERSTYNYIHNTQGAGAAQEYLDYLSYTLNARRTKAIRGAFQNMNFGEGVAASAISVPANLLSGMGTIDVAFQNLKRDIRYRKTGEYTGPIDYNSDAMMATHLSGGIRESVSKSLADRYGVIDIDPDKAPMFAKILNGKSWGDVYQLGMSMLDSIAIRKLVPIIGRSGTVLLGGAAASQGMLHALEQGATDEQALKMGFFNGLWETLFESWSLDKILSLDTTSILKAFAKQGFIEATEEANTGIANYLTDVIVMGRSSEFQNKVRQYTQMGYTEEEAKKQAFWDAVIQVGWDFAGGFISGGLMGGGQTLQQNMQYRRLPANIRNQADRFQEEGIGRNEAVFMASALDLLAEEYGDQAEAFRSNFRTSQDVAEYQREFHKAYKMGVNNANRESLNQEGAFRNLTEEQRTAAYEAGVAAREAKNAKAVESKAEEKTAQEGGYAVSEDGNAVRTDTGETVEIKGFRRIGANPVLDTKSGNTVNAADVSYASAGEAALYEIIGKSFQSVEGANTALEIYRNSGMTAEDFAAGVEQAFNEGRLGQIPLRQVMAMDLASQIPEAVIKAAYNAGEAQGRRAARAEQREITGRNQRRGNPAREGKLHFDRKGRTFDEARETSLSAMETLAKALGIDIYVFASYEKDGKRVYIDANGQEVKAPNGFYDPSNSSIHIDLNAGNLGKGTMLFTVAHELTHFIRQWSKVKFRTMADILIRQYGEQGTPVEDLIAGQIAKAANNKRKIKPEEAFEEVVADSMEAMLVKGDMAKFLEYVQRRDKNLGTKIRYWLRNLADKLRAAVKTYGDVNPETAEGRLVAQMGDFIQVLQASYTQALVDASENYRAAEGQKNTTREGGVKYSFAGYAEDGRGIYISNFPANTPKPVKSARIIDLIQQVWSKKPIPLMISNGETSRVIYAQYDPTVDNNQNTPTDASKIAGGNRHGNATEKRVTLNLADDYYRITQEARYNYSKEETGKSLETHKDVKMWHYFLNDIYYSEQGDTELHPYTVTINVKEKANGQYVYSYNAEKESSTQRTLHAAVNTRKGANGELFLDDIVTQPDEEVKTKSTEKRSDRSRVEMTREQEKFSMRGPVEYTKNLVALHNLTDDKLAKALDLGGFPMPSIAITKADIPHTNFGDITLVFGRDTIDPKANRKNTVYSADAWTPTFPRTEYEEDQAVGSAVSKRLIDLGKKIDDHFQDDLRRVYMDIEGTLNRYDGEEGLIQYAMDNYGLKAAYLEEQGTHIEKAVTQVEAEKDYNLASAERYRKIADILGVKTGEEMGTYNLKEARDEHGDELEAILPGITKSAFRMARIFGAVRAYLNDQGAGPVYKTVTDDSATRKAVDDALDMAAYEAWVRKLFSGIVKDSGIYNNKPIFTPSGNRRSFKQTHLPVTLENIVKAMAAQNGGSTKNVSGFNGIKTLRAGTAERLKSIEAMHQREGRLQNLTPEQLEAVNDALQSRLYDIIKAIDDENRGKGSDNSLIRYDTIGEIITEISEGGKFNVSDIQQTFRGYGKEISDDTALSLKQLLFDVAQMPVNIFEAKPERVVGLNEVKAAIVPQGTDQKIVDKLQQNGIPVRFYEAGNDTERLTLVNGMEEAKFSDRDPIAAVMAQELERQNEQLIADVENLKKLLAMQGKVTGGKVFKPSSVANAADYLAKTAGATLNSEQKKELAGMLDEFYTYIASGDELVWEDVREKAEPIARFLETNAKDSKAVERAYNYDLLHADLVRAVYDSYWRVENLRTVADKNLKEVNELKAKHRQQMEKLRTEKNEAIDRLRKERADQVKKVREESRQKIRDKVKATERRYQESRKNATEKRHVTATKNRLRKLIQEISALYTRGTKERNVKKGMRNFVEQALAAADVLWMENYSDEDLVRNGVRVQMSAEERKLLEQTQELLRQRDDVFKGGKAEQEIANIEAGETEGLEALSEQYEKLDEKIRKNMRRLQRVLKLQRAMLNETTITSVLEGLAEAYKELGSANEMFIRSNIYEATYKGLKDLIESVRGTTVTDMTNKQLLDVEKAFREVLHTIRQANKSFTNERAGTISERGKRTAAEVLQVGGQNGSRLTFLDPVRKFLWNNFKPVNAMETIGSQTLIEAFNQIRNGEDVWARDIRQARQFFREVADKYGYDEWEMDRSTNEFSTPSGKTFQLTLGQMMSIYAYSKRENAQEHLRLGGIVFDPYQAAYRNNAKKKKLTKMLELKRSANDGSAYQISMETVKQIMQTLTQEQIGFVDEMQKYLSETMGAKGNEVSMKLFGVELFGEENYFPMKSARQFLFEQNQPAGEVKLVNSGFTKAIQPGANNPIVLGNFVDVWSNHVNEMSSYHGFTLAIEDFNRIYNYQTEKSEGKEPVSVKSAIQSAYTPAATEYISQMITDVNGGARIDPAAGIMGRMLSLFKKGAVFASASVVIQQHTSIGRALALIDGKYFNGQRLDPKEHDKTWEEVKEYAPVAIIKEMGFFDISVGKATQDYITGKEYHGFREKFTAFFSDSRYRDEKFSRAPALADELTWCAIWEAVKREQAELNPNADVKSKAFLEQCGERFTEIITKTQVYDSVLSRSANMRSKDTGMQMATAFMAEPTTSINMLADALIKGRRGNKQFARKEIGAVIASQILNAVFVSLVYAMRDDDEDKNYEEKYLKHLSENLVSNVFFLVPNSLPFMRDIMSLCQGYEVERSDMSVISDMLKAFKAVGNENMTPWQKAEKVSGSVAQLFGLPVKNILRDTRGLVNTVRGFFNRETATGAGLWYAVLEGATGKSVSGGEQLYRARVKGDDAQETRLEARYSTEESADTAVRNVIREKFMDGEIDELEAAQQLVLYGNQNGNEAHWLIDGWKYARDKGTSDGYRLYGRFYDAMLAGNSIDDTMEEFTEYGYDEEDVLSNLKKEIGKWYYDDESDTRVTREEVERMLESYFDLDGAEIEEQMLKWDMRIETGFSYQDLKEQFFSGAVTEEQAMQYLQKYGQLHEADAKERMADWKFEQEHGYSYDDIRITYQDGEITAAEARQVMMEFAGKTREEADKSLKIWDFELKEGWAYEDRAKLYKRGEISESQLTDALVEIGEYSREDARTQAEVYRWEMDGLSNVSISRVEKWHEYCEDNGISREMFLEIAKFSANTNNDVDENGKTVYYSAMKKVMAQIDKLPLSKEQKTALAKAMGWSNKNTNKYKPW